MLTAARIVEDMSITDYHADHAVSKSGLKLLLEKTPAHYFHEYRTPGVKKPQPSPQKIFGQALHTIVLEEDKFKASYIEAPAVNKNTIRYKSFKIEAAAAGKIVLDAGDMARLVEMRHALYAHSDAIEFLPGPHQEGALVVEASFFWQEEVVIDPLTGKSVPVMCKCRPDMLLRGRTLRAADLKSTRSAKAEDFKWDVFKYGYHIQDASYTAGVNKLEADLVKDFTFVAIESEPPHCIALYELSDLYKEVGFIQFQRGLQIVAECEKSRNWPGYPSYLQTLDPPQKLLRDYSLNLPTQDSTDATEDDFIIA